jgi:mRNA interferase YafQ
VRRIDYGSAFRKDYKRMSRRGADLRQLDAVLELLTEERALPEKNRQHMLSGEWKGFWE